MTQNEDQQYQFLLDQYEEYFDHPPTAQFDINNPIHALIAELYTKLIHFEVKKLPAYTEVYIDLPQLFKSLFQNQQDISLFVQDPQNWINASSLALHHLLKSNRIILPRFYNFLQSTPIRAIMSTDIGRFVSVEGQILQITPVKLQVVKMCYQCQGCGQYQLCNTIPKFCTNCDSKSFAQAKSRSQTIMYQRIKLQEMQMDNGRTHQTITVELRHNHVGTYISGDKVQVHGILKTEMENNALFTKYIEANNISNLQADEQCEFSQKDMELINHHLKEKTLFSALVKSFCPAIYGQELVKAGLLLCMIGLNNSKRMNSHCLMIGDPGQGKSQLLKFVNLIAPRSVYVTGTGTSQCGLTCSLRNEEIDAGALVMADEGVCCIDEFDKMDQGGLLEAMEQQTVSLAKAGVLCQLQARVSVIATANPVNGHYQKNKSFMENIKIATTILSRFDLIFLMVDDVDPQRDEKLSKHILQMPYKQNRENWQGSLKTRLQDETELIEEQFQFTSQQMKKLIGHIKKHSEPKFSQDASRAIGNFYMKLRKQGNEIGITTRTLESLVRLSISRCKFDLRDEVSLQDAEFVISLMEECKFDCFYQCEGIKRVNINGSKVISKAKQTIQFLEYLKDIAIKEDNWIFTKDQMKEIGRELNLIVGDFGEFLSKLNEQNYLLMQGGGNFELQYGK